MTAPIIVDKKVPTSNFRSIKVRRYLDLRVARVSSMSNLPPRVSHQERCCLVMRTTLSVRDILMFTSSRQPGRHITTCKLSKKEINV